MDICVNGDTQRWEGGELTIAALLAENKVDKPEMVSVQLNGSFVDKSEYGSVLVAEGDEIDFLYFMGGGAAV